MHITTRVRGWLLVSGMVASAACGDDPVQIPRGIGISVNPGSITVAQGGNGSVLISLSRIGEFTGPVTLTVTGLPAGVTTTITPATLTGATANATITVAVGAAVTPGTYPATVTATGEDVETAVVTWQLTVTAAGT